jgi:putative ABC transport system permease protein
MSPAGLAWRSLTREPLRAVLGVVGVAIVGALLLDMLLLSRGLLVSFRDLLQSTGYEVRVTATEAPPGLGPPLSAASEVVAALAALPEIHQVVAVRAADASALDAQGKPVRVTAIGMGARSRSDWRVVSGGDLSGVPHEVLVNVALARSLQLEPGAVLRLRPGRPSAGGLDVASTLHVVGVAEFPFDVEGERTLALGLGDFRQAQLGEDRDDAELLMIEPRPGVTPEAVVAAVQRARPDLHAFSIEDFLERFRVGDFSYFSQISFVLSAVTSFFAFLLLATLLTVSVNQRLAEVATLRALGFARFRIAQSLLCESALLVGLGGALAIPLGLLLAQFLDGILRRMPNLPSRLHFFVLEPGAMALHLVLLGLAGLLAAAYPVLLAVRLPIAATLRREVIS